MLLEFKSDNQTLSQILGDEVIAKSKQPFKFKTLSTDSRKVDKTDLFVALIGDNHDAHDFINQSMLGKVAAVLVEKKPQVDIPFIQVKNTRKALAIMAKYQMQSFSGKAVVLTGSVGKTSNKEMLAAVLSVSHQTFATKGNLNNDIGVPFTLFSMPKNVQFAVIEMGADCQGEIAYLANMVNSDVAMITNAGPAHLEGFGGLSGVAIGKGEIFASLKATGTAVINLDDHYASYWQELCANKKVLTFSKHNQQASVYASDINNSKDKFKLMTQVGSVDITLKQGGSHHIQNALGVAACAVALGVKLADIAKGLYNYQSIKGRYKKSQFGKVTVIDDSYNANPASVCASAELLENEAGYKIIALGDMKELGVEAISLHQQTAEKIKKSADCFLCLGELTEAMMPILGDKGRHFTNREMLCESLLKTVNQQTICSVLIKGSLSMQMGKVVAFITEQLEQQKQQQEQQKKGSN